MKFHTPPLLEYVGQLPPSTCVVTNDLVETHLVSGADSKRPPIVYVQFLQIQTHTDAELVELVFCEVLWISGTGVDLSHSLRNIQVRA